MDPSFRAGLYRNIGIFFLAFLVLFTGCVPEHEERADAHTGTVQDIRHAVGFGIETHEHYRILHVYNQKDAQGNPLRYVMARDRQLVPKALRHTGFIEIPVRRLVLLHTPYISYFDFCNAIDRIAALAETSFVYNPEMRRIIQSRGVPDIGSGTAVDVEALVALRPDVVITVGFPDAPNKHRDKIEALGYPVLVFNEWQEKTLLGRMEWVKIVAALVGTEEETDSKFREIEQKYRDLAQMAKVPGDRPTVMCNAPYKGAWYVPGGKSYMGNLLRDASASYIWEGLPGTGAVPLGLEQVFAEAKNAALWINPGTAKCMDDIVEKDSRLGAFKPYLESRIYNCDRRTNSAGANDYWESGVVNPHLILSDLVHILHPEILPAHDLVYYRKLKPRSSE